MSIREHVWYVCVGLAWIMFTLGVSASVFVLWIATSSILTLGVGPQVALGVFGLVLVSWAVGWALS